MQRNKTANLQRFVQGQQKSCNKALPEVQQGRKTSHWMWYIFPQIAELGCSATSKLYALKNLREAEDYLNHPVLGARLVEISAALLQLESNNATAIFGNPDDMKLHSCITLFAAADNSNPVLQQVMNKFYW